MKYCYTLVTVDTSIETKTGFSGFRFTAFKYMLILSQDAFLKNS